MATKRTDERIREELDTINDNAVKFNIRMKKILKSL